MASNNVKVLSQCATIFQLTGFQYFSIENIIEEKNRKYPKISYIFYFIILICLIPISLILTALMVMNKEHADNSVIEQLNTKTVFSHFINNMTGVGFVSVSMFGVYNSFSKTNQMKKCFLNFKLYQKIAKESFFESVNYKKFRNQVFGHFCITFAIFVILEIIKTISGENALPFPQDLVLKFTYCVCLMSVQMILYHVNFVNTHLDHLISVFKSFLHPFGSDEIIMVVDYHQKSRKMSSKIKSAKKLYNIIRENSEIINLHQGVVILLIFISYSLICISSCFSMFVGILGKKVITTRKLKI